jgi:hypothetical protein
MPFKYHLLSERDVVEDVLDSTRNWAAVKSRQSNPIWILTLCHLWSLPLPDCCTQNFCPPGTCGNRQRQQPGTGKQALRQTVASSL